MDASNQASAANTSLSTMIALCYRTSGTIFYLGNIFMGQFYADPYVRTV